jgi:hypothetical protein
MDIREADVHVEAGDPYSAISTNAACGSFSRGYAVLRLRKSFAS